MKKHILYFLPIVALFLAGCHKDEDPPFDTSYLYRCMISEDGSQSQASSTDATVEFPSDSTSIDASFTNNRWLYFKVKGQVPGTYALDPGGALGVYNNSSNVEFYAQSGTLVFSAVDKAAKKVEGTFDDLILVSASGDTVRIQDGTFKIDN